jgi:predicted transcriptional regulator
MAARSQYHPTSNLFRILVDVDEGLFAKIDELAEEREEGRQTLLRRFIEEGLKRERRRLNRQRKAASLVHAGSGQVVGADIAAGGSRQAAAYSRRPDSRHDRVSPTPGLREVS